MSKKEKLQSELQADNSGNSHWRFCILSTPILSSTKGSRNRKITINLTTTEEELIPKLKSRVTSETSGHSITAEKKTGRAKSSQVQPRFQKQ